MYREGKSLSQNYPSVGVRLDLVASKLCTFQVHSLYIVFTYMWKDTKTTSVLNFTSTEGRDQKKFETKLIFRSYTNNLMRTAILFFNEWNIISFERFHLIMFGLSPWTNPSYFRREQGYPPWSALNAAAHVAEKKKNQQP